MLSYNSNYGESGEFVQYGPSKVGLTDCGLQCKVACGCNNSDYWYLTKPHSTHTTKAGTSVTSVYESVTSEYEYDYIIGDDGNLASTGTTLSSAGRTLSGSTKSLSASSGEKVTCYKQTCSAGFTRGEPDSYYFNYETETLDDGSKCYKVTSCKCTESASDIGDTYFNYSCPTYNGKTCCNVTSCVCSPNSTYFKRTSDEACGTTCYRPNGCQFGYTSWGSSTGQTLGSKCDSAVCKDVTCADEGTHDHNETWYDSTGGYSHYTTETSSYGNTCYTGRHNPSWYCTDSTYSYETSASAAPHASSAQKEQKCSTCGATTTGTCYAKGSHSYTCGTGQTSACGSCYTQDGSTYKQYCSKSGCTAENSTDCRKCKYISHASACGSDYTAEPAGKDCTPYKPTCSNGDTYTCYKDCKDKDYTVTIKKEFDSSCSGYNVEGAWNGINGGCRVGSQNCSTSSNSVTIYNVPAGSSFYVSETACYSNTAIRAVLTGKSGCTMEAGSSNNYELSATINSDKTITYTYSCQAGQTCGIDYNCPANTSTTAPSTSYFNLSDHTYNQGQANEFTCWGVSSCATSRGAYSTSPNTTYFNVSSSTMYGTTCYRATSCKSGYSSSGTGAGDTKSGITCKKNSTATCTASNSEDYIVQFNHSHNQSGSGSIGASCERGGPFTSISVSAEFGCPQGSRRFSGTVNCGGSPKLDNLGTYTDFCAYGSSPTFMSGSFTAGTLTAINGGYFESGGKCYKLIFSD